MVSTWNNNEPTLLWTGSGSCEKGSQESGNDYGKMVSSFIRKIHHTVRTSSLPTRHSSSTWLLSFLITSLHSREPVWSQLWRNNEASFLEDNHQTLLWSNEDQNVMVCRCRKGAHWRGRELKYLVSSLKLSYSISNNHIS